MPNDRFYDWSTLKDLIYELEGIRSMHQIYFIADAHCKVKKLWRFTYNGPCLGKQMGRTGNVYTRWSMLKPIKKREQATYMSVKKMVHKYIKNEVVRDTAGRVKYAEWLYENLMQPT